ncbi:MAG: hypothetical protein KA085_04470 [Phenylobacterium sp.]|uniref:hypothetical protein n=1 Tax=Phenylobacterium sp. TaxID=1871053 RepID=UPI001B686DFC|nr:hypothetical protein [Phenylobacterium sp.]MBP7650206.1 hypothetical protein [Phenylobacterium sp.]MBP7815354.1 hypothetical protein [Phenylobacterium sp.]MBP9230636.1 hypothetical protein [Phenylobacterium sp.]
MSLPPTLDIYIGYDVAERVAYHVLSQSLIDHASRPVRITPIALSTLSGLHGRPRVSQQSTDFSFSRFLTPFLSGYEGWSLFMDCDMLVRADIAELFALADDRFAVMVAQHDYAPRDSVKFLGAQQLPYPKKNWSSVVLFNNARCRALTPDYVDTASGLDLHQFRWLCGDEEIGALPLEWNWLVGEYPANPAAKIAHFTRGGPYFADYADCDHADEWRTALARTTSVAGSGA